MDNADKIKLTHKEVALFLGDELKQNNDKKIVSYNLEDEYAKTAHHKSKFVWILLALCFVFVFAGTLTAALVVSSENQKISIKIDTFNDLNLKSLLNMVGQSQTSYDQAVKLKTDLEEELSDKLDQLKNKYDSDIFTLESVKEVSTKKSVEQRRQLIENEYNDSSKRLNDEYSKKIRMAEKKIKEYEAQISSFDSAMVNQAKKAEDSIDSQRKLHTMEMKNQESKYEAKIRDLRTQIIAIQLKAAEDQRKAIEEVRSSYQTEIQNLKKHITTRNDAMEQLAKQESCNGFILEVKDENHMNVYLTSEAQKLFEYSDSIQMQITEYKTVIATLTVSKDEKEFHARVIPPENSDETIYIPKTGDAVSLIPAPDKTR